MSDFVGLEYYDQKLYADSSNKITESNPTIMKDQLKFKDLKMDEEIFKQRYTEQSLDRNKALEASREDASEVREDEYQIHEYEAATRKQTRSKAMKKVKSKNAEVIGAITQLKQSAMQYEASGNTSGLTKRNYDQIQFEKAKLDYNILKLKTFEKKSESQDKAIRKLTYLSYLRMQASLDQLRDTRSFNQNSEEYKKLRKEIDDKLIEIKQEYLKNAEVDYNGLSIENYREHPIGQKIDNNFKNKLQLISQEYEASAKTQKDKQSFDKKLAKLEDARNEELLKLFKPFNKFLTRDSIKVAVCKDTYNRFFIYYKNEFINRSTKEGDETDYTYSIQVGDEKYIHSRVAIDRGQYISYLKPVEFDENNQPLQYPQNIQNFKDNEEFLTHWSKQESSDAFLDQWYKDYISRINYVVEKGNPSTEIFLKDYKNFVFTQNSFNTFENNMVTHPDPFLRTWFYKQGLNPELVQNLVKESVSYSGHVIVGADMCTSNMPGLFKGKICVCETQEEMIKNQKNTNGPVTIGQEQLKQAYILYQGYKKENQNKYETNSKFCIKGPQHQPLTLEYIKGQLLE